ncbi:hypothetical protein JZ751_021378, partial [Albula glossodonta]
MGMEAQSGRAAEGRSVCGTSSVMAAVFKKWYFGAVSDFSPPCTQANVVECHDCQIEQISPIASVNWKERLGRNELFRVERALSLRRMPCRSPAGRTLKLTLLDCWMRSP